MTKDDYRKFQKEPCVRGNNRSKNGIYGCPCCRANPLGTFKKYCRRRARTLLKRETQQHIRKETVAA
jgi:hypothetical protein